MWRTANHGKSVKSALIFRVGSRNHLVTAVAHRAFEGVEVEIRRIGTILANSIRE